MSSPLTPDRQPPGPAHEPARGPGGYTPPPGPPAARSGGGGGGGMRRLGLIGLVLAVVIGGIFAGPKLLKQDHPSDGPVAVAVQQNQVLQVGGADIDEQATEIAKELIRNNQLPPPPPPGQQGPAQVQAPPEQQNPGTPPVQQQAPTQQQAPRQRTPRAPRPRQQVVQEVQTILAQAPQELRQAIVEQRAHIYVLHVRDNVAQDGDRVEVFVNGDSQGTLGMTNAGTDFRLALPLGSSVGVRIAALEDGGGGVTVGVRSAGGSEVGAVLQVGASANWTFVVQ